MPDFAFLTGAIVGSAVLTSILHLFTRNWPAAYGKVVFLSGVALLLAIIFSAIGESDGGPPTFRSAPYYLFAQVLILIADLARTRGKLSKKLV